MWKYSSSFRATPIYEYDKEVIKAPYNRRHFFSYSENRVFDLPFKFSSTLPLVPTVFSVIKINKRNGTTIYIKNSLIRNGRIMGFFISLEKDADVIIGGVRPKKCFVIHLLFNFFLLCHFVIMIHR